MLIRTEREAKPPLGALRVFLKTANAPRRAHCHQHVQAELWASDERHGRARANGVGQEHDARGLHVSRRVHPARQGRQRRRPREQEGLARLCAREPARPAAPRLLRLHLRRAGAAAAAEARGEQDHVPQRLDQHVLLAPALRLCAVRGRRPGGRRRRLGDGHQARGHPQARPRAGRAAGHPRRRPLQVPHAAALLGGRRGDARRGLSVGRARDRLHPLLQVRCLRCPALQPPPCSGGRSRSRPHEIGSSPCCTCARPGTRHARCFRAGRGSRPRGRPFPLLARLRAGPTGWRCRRTQRRWTRSSG